MGARIVCQLPMVVTAVPNVYFFYHPGALVGMTVGFGNDRSKPTSMLSMKPVYDSFSYSEQPKSIWLSIGLVYLKERQLVAEVSVGMATYSVTVPELRCSSMYTQMLSKYVVDTDLYTIV